MATGPVRGLGSINAIAPIKPRALADRPCPISGHRTLKPRARRWPGPSKPGPEVLSALSADEWCFNTPETRGRVALRAG